MYALFQVHKEIIDNFRPFRPTFSAINTPTYNLTKFLVPILKSSTSNEYTVKHSFAFDEEIFKVTEFFLGSIDIDSLFTNIRLEETINICDN